ncbi:MAG TPA: RNA polymerase sigma factor, partial [Ktedonobacterales bacterium]|nr:RNA polymerase sigma factor [Ktedonobacterales bacterium]
MQPRCERDVGAFEAALAAERARLVRLCARITGDADAAEDLAQETLVEAWRARGRLRDPGGLSPWLAAIARNVCLRWARGRGRELARRAEIAAAGLDGTPPTLDDLSDGDEDIAVDLERGELAQLLDRALALLPA